MNKKGMIINPNGVIIKITSKEGIQQMRKKVLTEIESKINDEDEDDDDYLGHSITETISFIEFAIINAFLHDVYRNKMPDVEVTAYGTTDSIGRIKYGGTFDVTSSFWFNVKFKETDNDYIIQSLVYQDNRNELIAKLSMSSKKGISGGDFDALFKTIKGLAFNNSEYTGKCIKVKLREGTFRGIEIIDINTSSNELILNPTQDKYIKLFIKCLKRGGNSRYLFNGEPGTGKTECIREIGRQLAPKVTFIVPEFTTADDLSSIMEACEIFDHAVIIMDDIDLYLGSRDNGSYTRLLGQFLSFFDGVKKRNISLLASTNDKGLVDKAAERPGRFNVTLDYGFLDAEQIVKVCNIHLPEKWRIKEVYEALSDRIDGKKANITGAFIANLAENIREMSEGDDDWDVNETVSLIQESYRGFYLSQVDKGKESVGFK